MLDITATDMDIAESNPLRYRGYYYDNETGYYYLQSRYYDPELGRFISADGFEYLDTSNRLNANAYIYCWNCPTAFEDTEGTTPKLSADKQTIFDFLSNISSRIRERISSRFQNLQSDFNASVEMLKFYYMNPGELTSDILSGLFGKDIHIEFKLLKEIRSKFVSFLQNVNELLKNLSDKSSNEEEGIAPLSSNSNDKEDNNIIMAIIQSIVAAIELDWINDILEFFGLGLEKLFTGVSNFLIETTSVFLTALNVIFFQYFPDYIRNAAAGTSTTVTLDKMFDFYARDNGVKKDVGVVRGFGALFALIGFSVDMDSAGEGRIFTKTEDTIMNVVGLVIDLVSLFLGPVAGILVPIVSDIVMDITALRIKGFIFMC